MQLQRAFALSCFQVRQIALHDAYSSNEVNLFPSAKLPQHPDRILAIRKTIDDLLGQQRHASGNFLLGACDQSRRSGILHCLVGKFLQMLVFSSRQDREFPVWRCFKSDGHDNLSIVNFAPMSNSGDDDRAAFLVEAYHDGMEPGKVRAMTLAKFVFVVLVGLMAAVPAGAVQPDEILKDPVLESRARTLSQELRCMVCQNQSIDDSDAPLAKDLRILVRERLTAGDSDGQVISFLVARYGEFVLLKPRVNAHTALLWSAPFAVLIV